MWVLFIIAYLSSRHVAQWRRGNTWYNRCRRWRGNHSWSSQCIGRNWVWRMWTTWSRWNMLGNRVRIMLQSVMSWGWWAVRCKRKTLFLGRSWLLKFTKTSSSCRLNKNNIVIGLRTNQESMLWVFDVGARSGSTARHSHMHPSTTWRVKSNGRAVANAEMPWQVRVTNTENIWSQLKRLMMVETNMTHCCNFSPTPNHSSTFWTRESRTREFKGPLSMTKTTPVPFHQRLNHQRPTVTRSEIGK